MRFEFAQLMRPRLRRRRTGVIAILVMLGSFTRLAFAAEDPPRPVLTEGRAPSIPPKSLFVETRPALAEREIEWAPATRGGCRLRARCNGARRIPVATGKEAIIAESLELGTIRAAATAIGARELPRAWVEAIGDEQPSVERGSFTWPVDGGRFGRGVGFVRRGHMRHMRHDGVDIAAPAGAPIRAAERGLVVYADNGVPGYGNLVILAHPDGTTTMYAHCSTVYAYPGVTVARGERIADVGATGIARGPHLHFEWHRHGRATDPMGRFPRRVDR